MNSEDFKRLEQIVCNFKEEVKAEFRHQIGIQSEHFQHKLDLVAEGHQMLSENIDRLKTELSQKIECVTRKLDAVAADLSAHRADTEVHKKVYGVRED